MYAAAGERRNTAAAAISSIDAEATRGDLRRHRLRRLAGREPAHPFGVADRPRRDAADAHAEPAPLDREVARHRIHAGLRRRRVDLQRRAVIVERRADVEDERIAALAQRLERRARRVERAAQVDVDDRAKAVRRERRRRRQEVAGGAVDQRVELAELRERRRDGLRDHVRIPDVCRVREDLPARLRAQLGGGLREPIRLATHDAHIGTESRIGGGDPAADAGATAGDERHAAGEGIGLEHIERTCHRRILRRRAEIRNLRAASLSDCVNPMHARRAG